MTGPRDTRDTQPDVPLSDTLRQEVITEVLRDRELPVTVDELTDRIYQWEVTNPRTLYSRQDLREHLVEVDLPALESRGAVRFDRDRGLVDDRDAGGAETDDLSDRSPPSTESAERGRDDTRVLNPRRALGATGLFGLALVAVAADVGPFAAMDPWVVAAGAAACFAGAALVDLR